MQYRYETTSLEGFVQYVSEAEMVSRRVIISDFPESKILSSNTSVFLLSGTRSAIAASGNSARFS